MCILVHFQCDDCSVKLMAAMASTSGHLDFFFESLSAVTAEALLRHHGMADGLFLVRESREGKLFLNMAYEVRIRKGGKYAGRNLQRILAYDVKHSKMSPDN